MLFRKNKRELKIGHRPNCKMQKIKTEEIGKEKIEVICI